MTTEDFKRKLTAILSADVVGYSRLMGDDEAATVKTLETYKGVMSSLIRQHRGRVVDSPGDNLLAEFGSVVDAVQCAVSIQKELQARNGDLPENRRMAFRIGINLGDVIEEGDRIYGDGVNIAARLEALADPGGICISKTAFDHIESKLPLGYEFLGEQIVKNIAKPVGAYRVLMETRVVDAKTKGEAKAVSFWRKKSVISLGIIVILAIVAVLYWNFYLRGPSTEPASIEPEQVPAVSQAVKTKKTIAVLPFTDLSPEKDQEYFVDGLSEELLNTLTQIPDLLVTGRTSSFSFRNTNKTVQEIAGVLGVENILEGSVRKAGNQLRVTAQLLRGADGFHLWSKEYDRELEDIFVVQEDIATAVADELKISLGLGKSLKQIGGTDNPYAYELYLSAQGELREDTYSAFKMALVSIDNAISLDPKFAMAWVVKAQIHMGLSVDGPPESVKKEQDTAIYAAKRFLELEPSLEGRYCSLLGEVKRLQGDFMDAELYFRKAQELTSEPSSMEEGIHYLSMGHFKKAYESLDEAKQNDPLNQTIRGFYLSSIGILDGIQKAEEEYTRGRALFGDDWGWGNSAITWLRLGSGDIVTPNQMICSGDPKCDAVKEHLGSVKDALRELYIIYDNYNNPKSSELADMAIWAACCGDPEFALKAIEKSFSIDYSRQNFIWFPVMHEVRRLPRFKELVKKIGLVDYWNKFGWPDICHKLDNGDFECD